MNDPLKPGIKVQDARKQMASAVRLAAIMEQRITRLRGQGRPVASSLITLGNLRESVEVLERYLGNWSSPIETGTARDCPLPH